MERAKEQEKEELLAQVKTLWPFEGKRFSVKKETLHLPRNRTRVRETVVHTAAVVLIPLLNKEKILFIQQYRRAAGKILIELPAGVLEEGDTLKERAQKELQEETGYRAKELITFGGIFSTPGFCTEYLHFFLAKDLKLSPLPADEDEAIDLLPLSLKKALSLIDSNEISDAKTLVGVLKYARLLRTTK